MIDLSHTIEDGMVTYPGLPAPVLCDFLSREASRSRYDPGTEFHIGRIDMVANTGTYIDSPFHRYREGADVAALTLEQLADVEGLIVHFDSKQSREIGPEVFRGLDVRRKAVLIHTAWSAHWRTDKYFHGHPFLAAAAADLLVKEGAALVGIDSMNIDDTTGGARPVHSSLLGAGIPIVEHLCRLDGVPDRFRFFAVPPKVRGLGTFPVRAFAVSS